MVFDPHGVVIKGFWGPNGGGKQGASQTGPPVPMRFLLEKTYILTEQDGLLTRRAHFGNGLHWFSQKKASKQQMYVLGKKTMVFDTHRGGYQRVLRPKWGW